MRRWLPAIAVGLASLVALVTIYLAPSDGQPVAVFFAPGTTPESALLRTAAAGGLIVRAGGWDAVIVARSTTPDFASALYRQGAWLVLSAAGAVGCDDIATGLRRSAPTAGAI